MELNADAMHGPVIEVLDRDGQVRQSYRVTRWPLTIGRALDNDLPLSDPHVAAHHLRIVPAAADDDSDNGDENAGSLCLQALDSVNGVQYGRQRLKAGESATLADDAAPPELQLGRTRLRLRLPAQPLAPELPLRGNRSRARRWTPLIAAALAALLSLGLEIWLESDPDTFGKRLASELLGMSIMAAAWCGLWAVLTKVFARQARFGWHLLVLSLAVVAAQAGLTALNLLAFSLSWPWASNFRFIASDAIIAAALYHHLLALEITRPRLLRALSAGGLLLAVGITLWAHQQGSDRYGAELYMSHLFPPALRLAGTQPVERFIDGLTPLHEQLDARAKKGARDNADGDSAGSDDDDDDASGGDE